MQGRLGAVSPTGLASVDTDRSRVGFNIRSFGLLTVDGCFRDFDATIDFVAFHHHLELEVFGFRRLIFCIGNFLEQSFVSFVGLYGAGLIASPPTPTRVQLSPLAELSRYTSEHSIKNKILTKP